MTKPSSPDPSALDATFDFIQNTSVPELLTMPRQDLAFLCRETLQMTQAELATLLRVHEKTVQRWEADPEVAASREMPDHMAQVLIWILRPGRPHEWPDVPVIYPAT